MRQGEDNLQQGKTWKNGYGRLRWGQVSNSPVESQIGASITKSVDRCVPSSQEVSSFLPVSLHLVWKPKPIICPFLVFPVSERMSFFGVLRPLHRSLDSHRSVVGPVTGSSAWPGRACRCSARLMSKFQEPNMVVGIVRKPNPQAS